MRHRGVVTNWHDERGFGFIKPEDGGSDHFLHVKALQPDQERPHDGMQVTYESHVSREGRLRAESVATTPTESAVSSSAKLFYAPAALRTGTHVLGYLAVIGFAAIMALEIYFWGMPAWVLAIYGGSSILSFALYWQDKKASVEGTWRVPEEQLHLLGIVGGWPGGVIAQIIFRHKTKKKRFARFFWFTALLNVLLFVAAGTLIRFDWINQLLGTQ